MPTLSCTDLDRAKMKLALHPLKSNSFFIKQYIPYRKYLDNQNKILSTHKVTDIKASIQSAKSTDERIVNIMNNLKVNDRNPYGAKF